MKHSRKDYMRIQDPANLIPDDEPVFLLRGQDVNAIRTLIFYRNLLGGGEESADMKFMIDSLESHITAFRNWQSHVATKVCDFPSDYESSKYNEPIKAKEVEPEMQVITLDELTREAIESVILSLVDKIEKERSKGLKTKGL